MQDGHEQLIVGGLLVLEDKDAGSASDDGEWVCIGMFLVVETPPVVKVPPTDEISLAVESPKAGSKSGGVT